MPQRAFSSGNIADAVILLVMAGFIIRPWLSSQRRTWPRPVIAGGLTVYAVLRLFAVLAIFPLEIIQ